VRSFACQVCQQIVFFENSRCLRCGAELGFVVDAMAVSATEPIDGDGELQAAVRPEHRFRPCRHRLLLGCNWLVDAADDAEDDRCLACRLTRTAPSPGSTPGVDDARVAWAAAETAKRRLVFQLLRLRLPLRGGDGPPLAFDLVYEPDGQVTTGHEHGLVTIDLAETDDARRERIRRELGEPYRTVLGGRSLLLAGAGRPPRSHR
jgi:hypothetical protein